MTITNTGGTVVVSGTGNRVEDFNGVTGVTYFTSNGYKYAKLTTGIRIEGEIDILPHQQFILPNASRGILTITSTGHLRLSNDLNINIPARGGAVAKTVALGNNYVNLVILGAGADNVETGLIDGDLTLDNGSIYMDCRLDLGSSSTCNFNVTNGYIYGDFSNTTPKRILLRGNAIVDINGLTIEKFYLDFDRCTNNRVERLSGKGSVAGLVSISYGTRLILTGFKSDDSPMHISAWTNGASGSAEVIDSVLGNRIIATRAYNASTAYYDANIRRISYAITEKLTNTNLENVKIFCQEIIEGRTQQSTRSGAYDDNVHHIVSTGTDGTSSQIRFVIGYKDHVTTSPRVVKTANATSVTDGKDEIDFIFVSYTHERVLKRINVRPSAEQDGTPLVINEQLGVDANISETDITVVRAYTGISITFTINTAVTPSEFLVTITISGNVSLDNVYDFWKSWLLDDSHIYSQDVLSNTNGMLTLQSKYTLNFSAGGSLQAGTIFKGINSANTLNFSNATGLNGITFINGTYLNIAFNLDDVELDCRQGNIILVYNTAGNYTIKARATGTDTNKIHLRILSANVILGIEGLSTTDYLNGNTDGVAGSTHDAVISALSTLSISLDFKENYTIEARYNYVNPTNQGTLLNSTGTAYTVTRDDETNGKLTMAITYGIGTQDTVDGTTIILKSDTGNITFAKEITAGTTTVIAVDPSIVETAEILEKIKRIDAMIKTNNGTDSFLTENQEKAIENLYDSYTTDGKFTATVGENFSTGGGGGTTLTQQQQDALTRLYNAFTADGLKLTADVLSNIAVDLTPVTAMLQKIIDSIFERSYELTADVQIGQPIPLDVPVQENNFVRHAVMFTITVNGQNQSIYREITDHPPNALVVIGGIPFIIPDGTTIHISKHRIVESNVLAILDELQALTPEAIANQVGATLDLNDLKKSIENLEKGLIFKSFETTAEITNGNNPIPLPSDTTPAISSLIDYPCLFTVAGTPYFETISQNSISQIQLEGGIPITMPVRTHVTILYNVSDVTIEKIKAVVDDIKTASDDNATAIADIQAKATDTKAVVDDTKAVVDDTKTVVDDTKTVADDTKAVVDDTKTVADDTKAVVDASKIVIDNTKTVADGIDTKATDIESTANQLAIDLTTTTISDAVDMKLNLTATKLKIDQLSNLIVADGSGGFKFKDGVLPATDSANISEILNKITQGSIPESYAITQATPENDSFLDAGSTQGSYLNHIVIIKSQPYLINFYDPVQNKYQTNQPSRVEFPVGTTIYKTMWTWWMLNTSQSQIRMMQEDLGNSIDNIKTMTEYIQSSSTDQSFVFPERVPDIDIHADLLPNGDYQRTQYLTIPEGSITNASNYVKYDIIISHVKPETQVDNTIVNVADGIRRYRISEFVDDGTSRRYKIEPPLEKAIEQGSIARIPNFVSGAVTSSIQSTQENTSQTIFDRR